MYFKGKAQVKTMSFTDLNHRKDRNNQQFQNSDEKDDIRNVLTYRKSKHHQYDGNSNRIGPVQIFQSDNKLWKSHWSPFYTRNKEIKSNRTRSTVILEDRYLLLHTALFVRIEYCKNSAFLGLKEHNTTKIANLEM